MNVNERPNIIAKKKEFSDVFFDSRDDASSRSLESHTTTPESEYPENIELINAKKEPKITRENFEFNEVSFQIVVAYLLVCYLFK